MPSRYDPHDLPARHSARAGNPDRVDRLFVANPLSNASLSCGAFASSAARAGVCANIQFNSLRLNNFGHGSVSGNSMTDRSSMHSQG